jgi:hypothetical protein
MPPKPADVTSDVSAPDATPSDAAASIKVSVPQEDGAIVVTTFDRKAPYRFDVTNGVVTATSQADADLLVARVDGAKLTS